MMKKWVLGAVAVLILGYGDLLPFENMDAGEMCIVETLFIEQKEDTLVLCSEGIQGEGHDFQSAVDKMKENAPGRLFLRQVKRVVFCRGAEKTVDVMAISEEIPIGAAVYCSDMSAEELMEELKSMEKRLKVQEQERKNIPTLAKVQNKMLEKAENEDK